MKDTFILILISLFLYIGNKIFVMTSKIPIRPFYYDINTFDTPDIIKNGFKISIGWNLGINGRSIHLIEPLTSTPIKGTSAKNIKEIKNKYLEIWNNFFWLTAEKIIKITTARIMKNKCFMKK